MSRAVSRGVSGSVLLVQGFCARKAGLIKRRKILNLPHSRPTLKASKQHGPGCAARDCMGCMDVQAGWRQERVGAGELSFKFCVGGQRIWFWFVLFLTIVD